MLGWCTDGWRGLGLHVQRVQMCMRVCHLPFPSLHLPFPSEKRCAGPACSTLVGPGMGLCDVCVCVRRMCVSRVCVFGVCVLVSMHLFFLCVPVYLCSPYLTLFLSPSLALTLPFPNLLAPL